MNKKFLSAILFGALMVTSTGTFVSCKDYDDDIKDLQEQIDKKAAITDLTTQVSNMQTALDAAKSSATDALAKAEEAKKAAETAGTDITEINAEIEALQKKIKSLEDATIDVEALKTELKNTIADSIAEADIDGLKKKVEDQLKVVTDLAGSFMTMVTEVDLYYKAGQDDINAAKVLNFSNVTEKENKFGPKDEIAFTKGTDVSTPTEVIVRVVPSNASLSKEMISLINGKAQSIMDQVTVESVEPYSELLTTSRGSETGLWKITFSLPKYNDKAFEAIKTKDSNKTDKILYAVAINDTKTAEGEDARVAISDYALTLDYASGYSASTLDFKAKGISVADIHNRFSKSEGGTKTSDIEDYIWSAAAATGIAKDKGNVTAKAAQTVGNDNRQDQSSINVEVGIPFDVEIVKSAVYGQTGVTVMPRAFYVTLDESHAVESNPSEINAWNSYNITGLNTVVDKASKLQITIPAESAKGDHIGFRVYAVNYDGTLVDPDGRAFYVYVAGASTTSTVSVMFKPETYLAANGTCASDKQSIATANWFSADQASLAKVYDSADADKKDIKTTLGIKDDLAQFVVYKGNAASTFTAALAETTRPELAKYTKIQMKDVEMQNLEDGKTYIAVINLINTNANNSIVETVTVSFTKVLPTFPASVKPFTNILTESGTLLKIYPKDIVDANAIYDLDNVWHGVDAHTAFVQTNATTQNPATVTYVATTAAIEASVTDNMPAFQVPAAIMRTDNAAYGTKYPMQVNYDFGYVSTEKDVDADGKYVGNSYWTNGTTFNVVFGNYPADCTYKWGTTAPTLVYPGVVGSETFIAMSNVAITDWYNRPVYLYETGTAPSTVGILNGYATAIKVNLLTGTDFKTVDEYYKAEIDATHKETVTKDGKTEEVTVPSFKLTSKSTASQGAAVPTKIQLTITDIYGGTVVVAFDPFTMNFQK